MLATQGIERERQMTAMEEIHSSITLQKVACCMYVYSCNATETKLFSIISYTLGHFLYTLLALERPSGLLCVT